MQVEENRSQGFVVEEDAVRQEMVEQSDEKAVTPPRWTMRSSGHTHLFFHPL
jgi:hypothetical protein